MRKHPKHILHTWWAAEIADQEAEAERALLTLFQSLPEAVPSTDFVDRVLAGAGLVAPATRFRTSTETLDWRGRLSIAASLVLAGLAAAFLLPAVIGLTRFITASEVSATLIQGFSSVLQWFAGFLSALGFFSQLSETLMLVVTTPPVALVLLVLASLATLAFRGLTELLRPRRSSTHVFA
jgi:hypothetical protein